MFCQSWAVALVMRVAEPRCHRGKGGSATTAPCGPVLTPRGTQTGLWDYADHRAGMLCIGILVCLSGSSFFPGAVCKHEGREEDSSSRPGQWQQIPRTKPAFVGCQLRGRELKASLLKEIPFLMSYPRLSLLLGFHLFRL